MPKTYCCYGMYADVGHDDNCPSRTAVRQGLHHELRGVIADVEQGQGFDAVCLETIKRVAARLAESEQQSEPSDAQMLETLRHIAAIAHEGGLANLWDGEALMLIRRLSRSHWKPPHGNERGHIRDAISAAMQAQGATHD